jgi:crotonobetainyl-CoA:carnitine CoA-transferase CaiB-like acyl-CoA transferase
MSKVLEGIRVVEFASYQLVPAAAAVLGEFGADVVKVEPLSGDPQRRLRTRSGAPSPSMDQTNRAKRSIALDAQSPAGRELLDRLLGRADVFMTNMRTETLADVGLLEAEVRRRYSGIVYARASAVGFKGPEGGKPGFDITAYWARGGVGHSLTAGAETPVGQRPGFGDRQGAMNLAFGVVSALLRRQRTGEGALVETSLLAGAAWSMASDIVGSVVAGQDLSVEPVPSPGPLNGTFRTADGRWLRLQLMDGGAWWPELCERLEVPELVEHARFETPAARRQNEVDLARLIADTIAARPLAEWREHFAGAGFPWEVQQSVLELVDDPQAQANSLVPESTRPSGERFRMVRAPICFDDQAPDLVPAPGLGAHSRDVLEELGLDEAEIEDLFERSVVA